MGDMMGAAQMLEVFARKCEEYIFNMENKHMVWLKEIEEEARRMFSSDFNAEPELMPKTPSQKRRRRKGRQSGVMEEKDKRLSRRSNNWRSSVRRLSMKKLDSEAAVPAVPAQDAPRTTRQTRAQTQKVVCAVPENSSMKTIEHDLFCNMPRVRISNEDRQSADEVLEMTSTIEEQLPPPSKDITHCREAQPPCTFVTAPQTPDGTCRSASKVKIASSTPENATVETDGDLVKMDTFSDQDICLKHDANEEKDAEPDVVQESDVLPLDLSAVITEEPTAEIVNVPVGKGTPTGSKSDRRSVRRSLVGRSSRRHSLRDKYSLASKRESMTREAMRKSIRRSISKKAWESSASSCHSSTDGVEEDTIKGRQEPTASIVEIEEPDSPQRSLRSRNARKIAISNGINDAEQLSLQRATRQTAKNGEDKENVMEMGGQDLAKSARRKSYKRAVDSLYDVSYEQCADDTGLSPPRKKTPSPPCPPNKVVRPPAANMRTFLHTVQKNQMLMSTPGSSTSKVNFVKSFIKRTTPIKSDIKGDFVEKERQRLEALRRKQDAEIQRKQKMEEEKRRKLEELKLRREERQRKVLQARERVEQIGEEKKRKIEQKLSQIDEKTEKVKEDRLAEEKAKKKLTAKKMEEVEIRRRQDEEARRQKIQQMEEEERKHQEMMQKKREEEEQERSKKIAEAKKLAEQRQAELERERQREQQTAAEKDLERKRDLERVLAEKERERQDKEKLLQQQREQEKAAREDAAAQERERVWRETEERKKKEEQEKLRKELEQERQTKEEHDKQAKEEQERKAREEKAKAEQERIAKENLTAISKALNVTLEVPKSPASQSYKMTPQNSKPKPPKICGDNYGMDLNSDDSTDDESEPRKPIPSWASGKLLNDILRQQFYNPINVDHTFGGIENPKLEEMFYKSKPRYVKRTSSAVWHSPPLNNYRSVTIPYSMKKY